LFPKLEEGGKDIRATPKLTNIVRGLEVEESVTRQSLAIG